MSDLPLAWLALPIYLAVGVALWRRWPLLRDTFSEAGYVGGMILTALIWPFMLVMLALIMVCVFVFYSTTCFACFGINDDGR
jgi:hypothetical protein